MVPINYCTVDNISSRLLMRGGSVQYGSVQFTCAKLATAWMPANFDMTVVAVHESVSVWA